MKAHISEHWSKFYGAKIGGKFMPRCFNDEVLQLRYNSNTVQTSPVFKGEVFLCYPQKQLAVVSRINFCTWLSPYNFLPKRTLVIQNK